MRIIILIIFFKFITISQLFSQIKNDNILQKTYLLFEKGNYEELIDYSKKALDENVDFFFLRLRLGIAYYKLKNYKMAIFHLEKSLLFNSDDVIAIEYLYYSYLFSGANDVAFKIKEKYKNIIDLGDESTENLIHNLYFETGISLSNNYSKNSNINFDGGKGIFGEINLNDNSLYSHLGAKIRLNSSIYFYSGFNGISVKNYSFYNIKKNIKTFDYDLKQWDYYLNSKFIIKNGITFSPALHLINVSTKLFSANLSTNGKETLVIESNKSLSDYILSSTLSYSFKKFIFQSSFSYSKLNENSQFQIGGEVMYFVYGNLNLYTQTSLTYLNNSVSIKYLQNRNNIIFNQMIGTKIFNKLWTEIGFTVGDMKDYNESNGFVVYNIPDVIKLKTYINTICPISSKIELSLRYQFLKRKDIYTYNEDINTIKNGVINYQNHTLIGGIKWKL